MTDSQVPQQGPAKCGGCTPPERFTIIRLPTPGQAFGLRQQERRRRRRTRVLTGSLYYAAVAAVPASLVDAYLVGRFAWGWVLLVVLLWFLGRAYDHGTPGVRGAFHDARGDQCAAALLDGNRAEAKQRAVFLLGESSGERDEREEYFAQQRMRLRNHGGDLERLEQQLNGEDGHA